MDVVVKILYMGVIMFFLLVIKFMNVSNIKFVINIKKSNLRQFLKVFQNGIFICKLNIIVLQFLCYVLFFVIDDI